MRGTAKISQPITTGGLCFAEDKKTAAEQIKALNKKVIEAGKKNDLQVGIEAGEDAMAVALRSFGEHSPEAAKAQMLKEI